MLVELKVSGFATIDKLDVEFLRPGLNVLTGETGAGKSILIKSLTLLFGGKIGSDVIRSGYEQASVEGAFDLSLRPDVQGHLEELGLSSGEQALVVSRIISRQGKNRVYINGHLATLNTLEAVLPRLVEITGQHEHHSLLRNSQQLEFLDVFAGLEKETIHVNQQFRELNRLIESYKQLESQMQTRQQRIDFLSFQLEEIKAFDPKESDETELPQLLQRSKNSAKLSELYGRIESALYGSDENVCGRLAGLIKEAREKSAVDDRLGELASAMQSGLAQLEEVARDASRFSESQDLDPQQLEECEERLSGLRKLQKKYGATVQDILAYLGQISDELNVLQTAEESLEEQRAQISKLKTHLVEISEKLHEKRKSAAKKLQQDIQSELTQLNMKDVSFMINLVKLNEATSTGMTQAEFMFHSSIQDQPRPISKIASGGELSRVMLALKQVIGKSEMPMTYLFDEVDAGVSGPTAEKVGKKLKRLAKTHQVITITHLPQVAAFADAHFLISKSKNKTGQLISKVSELNNEARIRELGRLISGEQISKTSLAHAKKLLTASR